MNIHFLVCLTAQTSASIIFCFFKEWENDFKKCKIIFSAPQNDLVDLNMIYIDISNEQKFVLWISYLYCSFGLYVPVKTVVFIWKSWDLQDWVIEIISPETSYVIVDYRISSYSFRPWISFLPWIVSRAKIKFTSWKIEILRQLHEFAIISKI